MRWRYEILSPVHIGSGETIAGDDLVRTAGGLAVVEPRAGLAELMRRLAGEGKATVGQHFAAHRHSLARSLARGADPLPAEAIYYEMATGSDAAEQLPERRFSVWEASKRSGREPYLPGTSVKGAIRTCIEADRLAGSLAGRPAAGLDDLAARVRTSLSLALTARRLVRDLVRRGLPDGIEALLEWMGGPDFERRYGFRVDGAHRRLVVELLGLERRDGASFAAALTRGLDDVAGWGPNRFGGELSALVFGGTPGDDWMRMMHVSDSHGEGSGAWTVYPVRVFATDGAPGRTISRSTSPEFYECLPPGLTGSIDVTSLLEDEGLAASTRRRWTEAHRWAERVVRLDELPSICRARSLDQIARELERARLAFPDSEYLEFHRRLDERARRADGGSFVLRIGGKNGWDMITVGELLGPELIDSLRRRFRLGKMERRASARGRDYFVPIGTFPKTRQLVVSGDEPILPFGWVELRPRT